MVRTRSVRHQPRDAPAAVPSTSSADGDVRSESASKQDRPGASLSVRAGHSLSKPKRRLSSSRSTPDRPSGESKRNRRHSSRRVHGDREGPYGPGPSSSDSPHGGATARRTCPSGADGRRQCAQHQQHREEDAVHLVPYEDVWDMPMQPMSSATSASVAGNASASMGESSASAGGGEPSQSANRTSYMVVNVSSSSVTDEEEEEQDSVMVIAAENALEPTEMIATHVVTATRNSGVQTNAMHLEAGPEALLPENLKQNLECPVCSRISLPPIMQCRNGHVTCNTCREKVQACPVCREIDIDIRNMFAEKAISFMTVPCEFGQFGCRVEIPFKEKEAHEKTCKYRPFICPYIECDHKLAADAVVDHVSTAHREECRRSDGPEITASMILIGLYFGGDGAWSPRLITCFGKTFFDVALTRDRWLHHWVWLLGEEEEAQQYLYEITAFKGNTRYSYASEVTSLRVTDNDIVAKGMCLSISDAIGSRLRDGDKIRYKLKLMRKADIHHQGAR